MVVHFVASDGCDVSESEVYFVVIRLAYFLLYLITFLRARCITSHLLRITCYVILAMYYFSPVTYYLLCIPCYVLLLTCHSSCDCILILRYIDRLKLYCILWQVMVVTFIRGITSYLL